MTVAAVILAAGASTRMGSPKQLGLIGGERLLERAVRVAREAGCSPVVVVLGAAAVAIEAQCVLGDAEVVWNKDWAEGMGGSIRIGAGAIGDVAGCVVMTCDMPAVTSDHLRRLAESGDLMASSYAGRHGVPAYFPATAFPQLLRLQGDEGARDLLRFARSCDLPGGELDVDTLADLGRAQENWGSTE